MRTPPIPLTLLTVALIGCTDRLPTALSDGGRAGGVRPLASLVALPFRGTESASHTSSYDPQTNTAHIHLVGTGTATHLGRYTVVSDIVVSAMTLAGTERITLTAANGDVLTAEATVQGMPSGDGVTLNALSSATITGGTGRFAGATGSFTLGRVNLAPDRFSSGSFDGTIRFDR
jgi:hypothetical protein